VYRLRAVSTGEPQRSIELRRQQTRDLRIYRSATKFYIQHSQIVETLRAASTSRLLLLLLLLLMRGDCLSVDAVSSSAATHCAHSQRCVHRAHLLQPRNAKYLNCTVKLTIACNTFNGVVINPEHVLHQFLTERAYNLRRRPHGSKTLLTKTRSLNEQDFFIRAMYKHSY